MREKHSLDLIRSEGRSITVLTIYLRLRHALLRSHPLELAAQPCPVLIKASK